jgi:cytochrome c
MKHKLHGLLIAVFFLFLIGVVNLTLGASGLDPVAGKDVFARRCSGCHAPDSDKEGPRLRGVLGRKAGSVAGFQYSDSLRNSGFVWDESSLNKWLENPQAVVKDNDMEFRVASPDERGALIAYLKSLVK